MAKEKTASDVSKLIKDREVKLVDFKFTDLPGSWQHFTTTLTEYNEDIFHRGPRFRRLQHPRLARDQRQRHARHSRCHHRVDRSL